MSKLIKTKAIFEIFLIITAILFIGSLSSSNAKAQETGSEQSQACCEKTKSGESCVYTDSSSCNSNFRTASKECSETVFCETGCCANSDGTCGNSASKSTCESKGGSFISEVSCSTIPLCNKGCCTVGNNYFLATKQQCVERGKLFPNLKTNFDSSVTDEFNCVRKSTGSEKGCCVQSDACVYTERDSCLGSDSTVSASSSSATASTTQDASSNIAEEGTLFESGKFCSKISICSCKAKDHKECFDGDVYWFDSCGNRESKAQDCDFAKNTLCNSKTLKCESLNCKTTIDKKTIAGIDVVSYDGVSRKNGESWCEYEGAVGFGLDLVGSRHYRDLCIAGEEFVEPCKDYREEFCLQANVKTPVGNMLESACKPNKWEDCTVKCNTAKDKKSKGQIKLAMEKDRECCEDPKRSCFWSSASDEDIRKINADAQKDLTSTCADAGRANDTTCAPKDYTAIEQGSGVCMPLIPPGLKFWNDENAEDDEKQSDADAVKTCEVGTKKCTVYFYKNLMTGWDWKMNDPGRCMQTNYSISSMAFCRSLGDCGAYYNVAGKFSNIAYACETSDGDCKGTKHGKSYDLLTIDWEKEVGGFDSYSKAKPLQLKDIDLSSYTGFGAVPNEIWMTFGAGFAVMFVSTAVSAIAGSFGATFSSLFSTELITVTAKLGLSAIGAGFEVGSSLLSNILGAALAAVSWLGIAAAVIAVLLVIASFIGADTDTLDITIACLPWQAPYGSKDCEKCTDKDLMKKLNFNSCTEYKCMSLGQNCKWVPENEGSNRTSCIAVEINDVTTPIIRPWPEALTTGYKITDFGNGYEITPAIEGYSMITLGILTNEPAQCKYAEEPGIKYDGMASSFGDVYIENKHMLTLTAMPNQLNEIYVKCIDANGNKNNADYLIKFNAKAGKDLTPPMILESSIKDNAVIAGDSTLFSLTINEPATCKYSSANIDYEKMENSMACNSDSSSTSPSAVFSCSSTLAVKEGPNEYYFRCKDTKGNANQDSFKLTLTGSGKLTITSTSPSGELDTNKVTIEATTEGGSNNGISTCSYTLDGKTGQFKNTNSASHSSELPQLKLSSYSIPISCEDDVGNSASATINFKVTRDVTPPSLMFLYKQDTTLIITMDEPSACEYSKNDFSFGAGTKMDGTDKEHTLNIESGKYHIICADQNDNIGDIFIIYP